MDIAPVTEFVDDYDTFDRFVNIRFAMVDEDGDEVLSRDQIGGGLGSFMQVLDHSRNKTLITYWNRYLRGLMKIKKGALHLKEFKSLMTEIMHALARGRSPITVVLEQDSLIMKAVQHEYPSPS